jgi:hypothetical protein
VGRATGAVNSDIWRDFPGKKLVETLIFNLFFLRTSQGAATSIAAATDPEVRTRPYGASDHGVLVSGCVFDRALLKRTPCVTPAMWLMQLGDKRTRYLSPYWHPASRMFSKQGPSPR